MKKQIKMFTGRWINDLEKEVNKFIKDKNVIDIRYEFHELSKGTPYHIFMIVYEGDE